MNEQQTIKPHFVAAKLTSTGEIAVAVEFRDGYIIGFMWLDILDMAPGVRAEDIKVKNNFRMKGYTNLVNCRWLPKDEYSFETYDRKICEPARLPPPSKP